MKPYLLNIVINASVDIVVIVISFFIIAGLIGLGVLDYIWPSMEKLIERWK